MARGELEPAGGPRPNGGWPAKFHVIRETRLQAREIGRRCGLSGDGSSGTRDRGHKAKAREAVDAAWSGPREASASLRVYAQLSESASGGFRVGRCHGGGQVEGAAVADGKGESVWNRLTRVPGKIVRAISR